MICLFKMKKFKRLITLTALLASLYLVSPQKAYAYLDPGTGSYIIQILIATLAGGTYIIFTSWERIKSFLKGLISKFSKDRKDAPRR